ncbi:AraC family transcriptional regulator [Labrys monachus]|uniref:AraC-like DNA-binding protein n=1 Tax=Labrys monachus TaxID=217067 RepID=A0ABU0FKB8_9HYPH|nr:AraC family transcriptional regulator [Labrys monachus]MDQ0395044.1 AraC-like DNA-binding protein [Labrys monachus]
MLDTPPQALPAGKSVAQDVLTSLLSTIRLSASVQFSIMAGGEWQVDADPLTQGLLREGRATMPFHVIAEGECWLKIDGESVAVEAGDILAFPWASRHQLGRGTCGVPIQPGFDLPERPWRAIPVLRYADDPDTRILCGFLQCDLLEFQPLKTALPQLIHIRTKPTGAATWLRAMVRQMVEEIDNPAGGGVSMLPRLTELMFIEILRSQIVSSEPHTAGWLAALSDVSMSRCLSFLHSEPQRQWSLANLALAAGMSRTALAGRFQALIGTSPMKYLRDWRLHLAGVALTTTQDPITKIAYESGYGTEAAFTRAFRRAFGHPPAAWRRMKTEG